ncbi:MAG: nuclear transport factor 2 family protein [Pseudomonadota bacterium]|nr:nuclear transport factor 2 family protein [Pseudomonadota bacterium]
MKKAALVVLVAAAVGAGAGPAPAAGAAGALSAQDSVEIQQLYAKYNIAIDNGDAEGYASTFTPDGVFNQFAGHDALVNFAKMWREKLNGATRKHWNNNLQISGNSKEASGFVYLMLVDISTKPASILTTATYTDSLVKTKEGWRFTKRTTKADAPPAAPPPAAGEPPK